MGGTARLSRVYGDETWRVYDAHVERARAAVAAAGLGDRLEVVLGVLHWEVFQLLGKLLPVVYLLRRVD